MEMYWERVKILMSASTVVELAGRLGVCRSTLSNWIHTDRRPPMKIAAYIAKEAGITIDELENGIAFNMFYED